LFNLQQKKNTPISKTKNEQAPAIIPICITASADFLFGSKTSKKRNDHIFNLIFEIQIKNITFFCHLKCKTIIKFYSKLIKVSKT